MEATPVSPSPAVAQALSGAAAPIATPGPRGPLWEGAVNARDLGGTGTVVPGCLYRMGRHEWLTATGWDQAWDQGVRTVIDLRNPFELGRRQADPVVEPGVLERFSVLNLPTEDRSNEEFLALTGPYLSTPEHYRENLDRWPAKFAEIVRAVISAPPGGVVIHCAAGRDRTGMVVALLLDAVGVPHAAIVEDYAAAVRAINDRYRTQEVPHERPRSDEELDAWLAHTRAHLAEFLAALDAGRFLAHAGVSDRDLRLLRERLTGPGPVPRRP
ncbi:tyrosine-protein phosphatase [Arthrobacter agilis]|uniref:tyrosine-protein phosphatase n=1 Tax=Arthrobacter agilis TaxID=37921 RepID=UPI000B3621BA|nr:tyrosine-protein phosphatase [Arthrobacter agilis]OUM42992.1 hypothetical protein B8W74_07000 [Arthrobacter agilis]PPB45937.1 protein-tyrosine-phosphatase [Arthrobacter agilis]TPV25478.1 tyrosine-protein phosphatase [Arthrobacter agilis]VDR33220.1 Tyrosine-protein phosphatase precursor [Arthrobacter agilis]